MIVLGVDEVGRGCWAGPLVASAVALRRPISGLKDSKLLTKIERERLDKIIRKKALGIGIGWIAPADIDKFGVTASVRRAMELALGQIQIAYDKIIIDGSFNFFREDPRSEALAKADVSIPAVSAASIIAKVARDQYMIEAAPNYPGYSFELHVGYGTRAHQKALASLGVCDLHRRSYKPIQTILGQI